MTALSELVLANLSAVFRLMYPKPYESSNIPTTTPPAPVHREGFTTSQLILIWRSSGLREMKDCARTDQAESEQNCSLQPIISYSTALRSTTRSHIRRTLQSMLLQRFPSSMRLPLQTSRPHNTKGARDWFA